ncbi:hypothetical protein As57867_007287, partial [Aphanomyces stellatus]
ATLELTTPDGIDSVTLTGQADGPFYAESLRGSSVVLTYTAPDEEIARDVVAFGIDKFAQGFPETGDIEAICGTDESQPSVCYKADRPTEYSLSQAVARLSIQAKSLCTAWLLGSEGHLITNNHCIKNADDAANIQVEFEAECASCSDPDNDVKKGCKGTIVATSSTFIKTNPMLDYTLVKLKVKPGVNLAKYGYLQAREAGPTLDETIWIPQHPKGKPTRMAFLDDGALGTVNSLAFDSACKPNEMGHNLDTDHGASGSPVLSASDMKVVALHNCGGCDDTSGMNGAIPMDKIIAELRAARVLPRNAV